MDGLCDKEIESMKKHIFNNTKNLLENQKIKVMFYDLTTIYFETNSKSDLKEFGYSKDGKSQHVQISLALIVTDHGLPVGYEIFKGNQFEGSTLIPVLKKLRSEYGAQDVTIVADSAMLSAINIEALIEEKFKFIISARIRNMDKNTTKAMLDVTNYEQISEDLRVGKLEFENKTIIVCHSKERARKDEYDRKKSLDKIMKLVGKPAKAAIKGSIKKPFVKISNEDIIEIDEAKLEEMAKFDGYFGFVTNSDLSETEVINHYRGLWQVEQSFRITKHNLKIRPVYHYVDRRIKAHFALCYLSLALIRTVEYYIKKAGLDMPLEQLNLALDEIKKVKLTIGDKKCEIITDIKQDLRNIFACLNIDMPKKYRIM
jgi:transposase